MPLCLKYNIMTKDRITKKRKFYRLEAQTHNNLYIEAHTQNSEIKMQRLKTLVNRIACILENVARAEIGLKVRLWIGTMKVICHKADIIHQELNQSILR